MKTKLHLLALLTSAMVLHGCGGGDMLGSSDADDHKLIPEEVTEDLTRPRPSENAPVMKTEGTQIYWADGREILVRGINLQYSDDPLQMITAFPAIAETGANFVRIQLSEDTTEGDLEAALNAAIANNMAAILTLNSPNLKCMDDAGVFTEAVEDLWLDAWLPVIAQDRYQDKIMINMASGWGPKEVFNGYSAGYRTYIDSYKTAIRQFRRAGLKFPLVIDAPGCGEDYHAFESIRAKELLAADEQKNLVLSVHAYGSTWNSTTKITDNVGVLTSQNMPVIMSEFGGSGLGEDPVKLTSILETGAGNYAANISVPWKSDADKLAMVLPLTQPVDVTNSEISFDVMLDDAYIADAKLGLQMYLRDSADRYANIKWHSASEFMPGEWSNLKYTIKNAASFNYSDSGFDLTSVAKFGVELVANGKAPEVAGGIKVDNFKVIEGVGPAVTYSEQFDSTTGGWVGTQWEGQPVGISVADGALQLTPQASGLEAGIRGLASAGVDFSAPVTINARIFFPESLGSDFFFAFYALDGSWKTSDYLGAWAFTMGEWNDISLTVDFSGTGNSGIAIQMGQYPEAAWADAIQIDYIEIISQPAGGASEMEPGIQYSATFDSSVENWGSLAAWGGASADFASEDGALKITPKHTGDGDAKVVINHTNVGSIEKLNFSEDPFTVKTRIMLPESYAGSEYSFQFLFQDSTYNVDIAKTWEFDELPLGEWVELTWPVDFVADVTKGEGFNRAGKPQQFVIQISGNYVNDPILIDEIIIEGMVPVEKEDVIIALVDFHYVDELARFVPDYVEGALVADELMDITEMYQRSAPFSWAAWSWYGNASEFAGWDMTTTIDSLDGITDRGVEIVLGKGGIVETLLGSVPDDEAAE